MSRLVVELTHLGDELGVEEGLLRERPREFEVDVGGGGGDSEFLGDEPFGLGDEVACRCDRRGDGVR